MMITRNIGLNVGGAAATATMEIPRRFKIVRIVWSGYWLESANGQSYIAQLSTSSGIDQSVVGELPPLLSELRGYYSVGATVTSWTSTIWAQHDTWRQLEAKTKLYLNIIASAASISMRVFLLGDEDES